MDWIELIVTVPRTKAETAVAVATALCEGGLYIEDYENLEADVKAIAHIDLIEQELLDKPRDVVSVHLYVSPDDNAAEMDERLRDRLLAAGVDDFTIQACGVRQQDWENAWKQHYHPLEIGARLAVAPSWEPYTGAGRVVLKLDPGMAFGTGTHETTALCLEALDGIVKGGERVLDIGCGSGILAIAALLLGASQALGVDIDPMAVRTATENAALNGVQGNFSAKAGDLAALAEGQYDIILANIVADAILRLAPTIPPLLKTNGVFLASGIIDDRANEIVLGLASAGLRVTQTRQKNGWVMLQATL